MHSIFTNERLQHLLKCSIYTTPSNCVAADNSWDTKVRTAASRATIETRTRRRCILCSTMRRCQNKTGQNQRRTRERGHASRTQKRRQPSTDPSLPLEEHTMTAAGTNTTVTTASLLYRERGVYPTTTDFREPLRMRMSMRPANMATRKHAKKKPASRRGSTNILARLKS